MGTLCRGWTTATRPSRPATGTFGWNRTTSSFEYWNGAAWAALGGGAGTPDYASIPFQYQTIQRDQDPAWPGVAGTAIDGVGSRYGWTLPPGQDAALYVSLPVPLNCDTSRNPILHVQVDDGGGGTNVNFWAVEVAIEDKVCGGPMTSGIRGPFPGMANQNVPDLVNTHQCLTFVGTMNPWAPSGWAHVSIRRRGTTDPAPGAMTVLGGTLLVPTLA